MPANEIAERKYARARRPMPAERQQLSSQSRPAAKSTVSQYPELSVTEMTTTAAAAPRS